MNVEGNKEVEEQEQEGHQLLNVTLAQGGLLPENRAYLDGCLTVTAFKMNKYLQEIKTVPGGIKINCNAGAVSTNLMGTYGNLKVWYIPDRIANIFLMHKLEKQYHIIYDSWEGYYVVHTPKGEVNFYKDKQGLPYIKLNGAAGREAVIMLLQSVQQEHVAKTDVEVLNVQTVHGNYEGHTKKDVLQAMEARGAQAMISNPNKGDFKGMVSRNLIKNCPVTTNNITNARTIFGPDLASIQGKTVRRTPAPVVADYVAVPRAVVEQNKVVTMAADVFFVDGTAFLITASQRIKFITAEHVQVRTATSLSKHLTRVLQVYERAGLRVRTILMDGEFEKVRDLIPRIECNTMAAKEHISKVEQMIQTIKERTRGLLATLPFQHLPRRMKIEFIYFMVLWLNAFPVKNGISSVFSLRELLVRWHMDYSKHCRVLPGTYCEVHDELSPSNMMTPWTHEAIAMGPTGNLQGLVKFFCLNTGRILKQRSFTALPMPDSVIKRVDAIGLRKKQGRAFWFLNRKQEPYKWTDAVPEDDPEFQGLLENEDEAAYPDISAEPPGVELKSQEADYVAVTDDPESDFK
jgi:hypothetical protein